MIYLTIKKRGELASKVESELVAIGKGLTGDDTDDLKEAVDRDPEWFGGKFPHMGCIVINTTGTGKAQDAGSRPSFLDADVLIFEPAMPVNGPASLEEDRQSRAKKITRSIADDFLEKLSQHPQLGPYTEVLDDRGGSKDDMGLSRTEEEERDILWVHRIRLRFSA